PLFCSTRSYARLRRGQQNRARSLPAYGIGWLGAALADEQVFSHQRPPGFEFVFSRFAYGFRNLADSGEVERVRDVVEALEGQGDLCNVCIACPLSHAVDRAS